MAAAASVAAVVDLCAAFIALDIFSFLDPQQLVGDPSAQAAALVDSAVELLLPLAALGVLATSVTAVYSHLQHSTAVAGAAGTRRLRRLFSILCASAGALEFLFFVKPAVVVGDVGAHAHALGLAAARVLPAAAAATFFIGMALIIVAHIRAGGEGGGGAFVAADDDGVVSFLTKTAFAAAAALVGLTALVALYYGFPM